MIEVNLLPGGRKRAAKRRGMTLALPKLGGGGPPSLPGDPYLAGAVLAGLVSAGVMAWLFLGLRADREEVDVALEAAVRDSARFADIIERTNRLTAQGDSIAQRVAIIQEIDAGRYVWPHVLDELARALPDFTWLREVVQTQSDPLQIRMSGRAGSTFGITNFMRRLEASPFFRGVVLERSEQVQSEADAQDIVYVFDLVVTYETPPLEELRTVPLFETGQAARAAVPDSAGG